MKRVLFLSAFLIVHVLVHGQALIKINDLNIPTSPAFVITGKSPSNIEKPSNPKALAVSLINVWEGNGAVEFAPYWLKDRPAYTFENNLNNKFPIFQTLGISGATSKEDSTTNIAVGLRSQLVRIYSKKLSTKIIQIKDSIVSILSEENPKNIDQSALAAEKDELLNAQSKTTLNIEVAGAYMGQSSKVQSLASNKAGAWLHLRFTPYQFPLDFTLLGRYSWALNTAAKSGRDSSFVDYGMSASYRDKEKNFELEVEYVSRRDYSINSTYDRFSFVANYQIIPGIVAVASVGKDFNKVDNVFALLGVKFGISKEMASLH